MDEILERAECLDVEFCDRTDLLELLIEAMDARHNGPSRKEKNAIHFVWRRLGELRDRFDELAELVTREKAQREEGKA